MKIKELILDIFEQKLCKLFSLTETLFQFKSETCNTKIHNSVIDVIPRNKASSPKPSRVTETVILVITKSSSKHFSNLTQFI